MWVRIIALLLLPGLVNAHGLEGAGFLAGLAHPMGGADHLVAMLAVGLASSRGGRALTVALPCAFLTGMVVGFAWGLESPGFGRVEQGVTISVAVLGLMLVFPAGIGVRCLTTLTVVAFGACHGYAHGQEWPHQTSALAFAAGFLGTSAGLHAIGVITGWLYRESPRPARAFATTGWVIASLGAVMATPAVFT